MIKEPDRPALHAQGRPDAEDAAIAVEHGVDVIWASNHGGRQIDHARGAMDTLPEIVEAVQGKARRSSSTAACSAAATC